MKGAIHISTNLILVIQYTFFAFFLISSVTLFYRTISTEEERRIHRLKILNTLNKGKMIAAETLDNESFKTRLEEAGLDFLTPFRYEVYRITILLGLGIYYIGLPALSGNGINMASLLLLLYLIVCTEHRIKIRWLSLINIILDFLKNSRIRKKEVELFTLYDLLKAELNQLNDEKEINVYSLLKEITPNFTYIRNALKRFLSLWMIDPNNAKYVFYEDIGTPSAKTIGEVLIKIDSSSKHEAIDILQNESSVFNQIFYKNESEKQIKRKNYLSGYFTVNILVSIVWLLVIISYVVLDQIDGSMF